MMEQVKSRDFTPMIIYEGSRPIEFSALPLTLYADKQPQTFDSISTLLEQYYAQRNIITRIRQNLRICAKLYRLLRAQCKEI